MHQAHPKRLMTELLSTLPDGVAWLALTVILAGLVRGFAGFGTALVFVPVAAQFLNPPQVVVTLLVVDILGPMLLVPDALRKGEPREVSLLGLGALAGIPAGVWLLTRVDPLAFRWFASVAVLILVGLIVSGWRYWGRPPRIVVPGIGALSGLMGGFSGLSGPPIILLYLGGQEAPARIRANIILFFTLTEFIGLATFWANGILSWKTISLGLILALPYTAATLAGSAAFRRFGKTHFRPIAYLVIAGAALSGLPLFD